MKMEALVVNAGGEVFFEKIGRADKLSKFENATNGAVAVGRSNGAVWAIGPGEYRWTRFDRDVGSCEKLFYFNEQECSFVKMEKKAKRGKVFLSLFLLKRFENFASAERIGIGKFVKTKTGWCIRRK